MNRKEHCNVSTVGHIDHGKTTLTAAITTVLYDLASKGNLLSDGDKKLKYDEIDSAKEEKLRGITINASHVFYQTEKRTYAHVDCPGHADYIKNMIVGASKIDGAILVVSATDGLMPQTREHVLLASRIGVKKLIVFVNKMDSISEDDEILVELIEDEIKELLTKYGYDAESTPFVKGSAKLGLELSDAKYGVSSIKELVEKMETHFHPAPIDASLPFLMSVEDVCSIQGRGTVATGRIDQGRISLDEKVDVIGFNGSTTSTVVIGIESFHKQKKEAFQGEDVGILLRGVARGEIHRGCVVGIPGKVKGYNKILCHFIALSKEEGGRGTGFAVGYAPQFFIRTLDVTGEIISIEGAEMVLPGETAKMEVMLKKSVPIDAGLRFAVREGGRTIGAGVMLEVEYVAK